MKLSLIERWNTFKLFDRNLVIYLSTLTFLIIVFQKNVAYWVREGIIHTIFILLIFIVIPWLHKQENPFLKWFRDWYLIAALPFLYWDVGKFIHLITLTEFDPLIIKLDHALFGILPNIWIQNFVSPILTEIMQVSYSIYWITIPLGSAIFYFQKDKRFFEHLLHLVSITFFLSYFLFIFFPVAGPRFFIADKITASYEGLFFTDFLRSFMQDAGFRGGAFPSSHVGVAMVILFFTMKFKPKIATYLLLPMVVALSIATVYGQYHYLSDVIFGLAIGALISWMGIIQTDKILSDL